MNFINIVSVSFVGLMKTGNLLEEINFIALVTIIFPQSSPMQTQRLEDFIYNTSKMLQPMQRKKI
jgi:hypothetical protein